MAWLKDRLHDIFGNIVSDLILDGVKQLLTAGILATIYGAYKRLSHDSIDWAILFLIFGVLSVSLFIISRISKRKRRHADLKFGAGKADIEEPTIAGSGVRTSGNIFEGNQIGIANLNPQQNFSVENSRFVRNEIGIVNTSKDLLLDSDPRIYLLNILEKGIGIFHETKFLLKNEGKDVAHKIEIEPITFGYKRVSFGKIDHLAPNLEAELPLKVNADKTNSLISTLVEAVNQAHNSEGKWDGKLHFQILICYQDHTGTVGFRSPINITFNYVQMSLQEKYGDGWPKHEYQPFKFEHEPAKKFKLPS